MTGHTTFSKETFAAFRADPRPEPVHLLNLIRPRPLASAADSRVVRSSSLPPGSTFAG